MENSFNSLKKLGDDNYKQNNYEEAIKYYTLALELNSEDNYLVYLNRCLTYVKLNNYDDALKDALTSTILKPDNAKGWSRVGSCLTALKREEEAQAAFDKAYQLESDNEIYKNLSSVKTIDLSTNLSNLPKFLDLGLENLMGDLFNKMMHNEKLIKLASDEKFKNKISDYQTNPLSAMQNPEIVDLINEVLKEL